MDARVKPAHDRCGIMETIEWRRAQGWSKTWTFYEGDWHEGNIPIMGRARPCGLAGLLGVRRRAHLRGRGARPRPALRARQRLGQDHVAEAGRFGGKMARADARRHQAFRQGRAALHPADVLGRAQRPNGGRARSGLDALCAHALRRADAQAGRLLGHAVAVPASRRMECMPVDAKAGCLYPNNARAMFEAHARGFGNCVVLDLLGNVAELATANVFIGKGRRGVHAGAERHVPQRHHPPARHQAAARGRRQRGRDRAALWRFRKTPTRYSRPAISRRSCRSIAWTIARCNPVRSTARRASSIGSSRTPEGHYDFALRTRPSIVLQGIAAPVSAP